MTMLYSKIRNSLYKLDPEHAHEALMLFGSLVSSAPGLADAVSHLFKYEDHRLITQVGGLFFPNPVGLAAGFDKNAKAVAFLAALGFGFLEVGTLTPRPQQGNPKPRLFRLIEDEAIINKMGFNNQGIDKAVKRLAKAKRKVPIGVNLGKNKATPNQVAADDYSFGMRAAWEVADYFTINISSPNTKDLRDLQEQEPLDKLLTALNDQRKRMADATGKQRPLWLKIAPDLETDRIKTLCDQAIKHQMDALVLTNTTLSRPHLQSANADKQGGLSGRPLQPLANQVLDIAARHLSGALPLVGAGGVFTFEDAWEKLCLGASLVQIYTGLIYQGPGMVKNIKQGLVKAMKQNSLEHISEAKSNLLPHHAL